MPLNDRKIIEIILEECETIEERCAGYREELVNVIIDVITAERQHRVQGTNIQQKIDDKFNAAGRFLAKEQGRGKTVAGES